MYFMLYGIMIMREKRLDIGILVLIMQNPYTGMLRGVQHALSYIRALRHES